MSDSLVAAAVAIVGAGLLLWKSKTTPKAESTAPPAGIDAGKQVVSTIDAPAAIGPYSQAIKTKDMVFVSGMVGLTPAGRMVEGGVVAEARQALTNMRNVLEAAGSSLDHVVKVTVLLLDIADYKAVNEVYSEFFNNSPQPARAAFAVRHLPANAFVEIDAVALLKP